MQTRVEQPVTDHTGGPVQHVIVLAALFASGCAALIYEVGWIRQASLVFGSTTFALSTVVAVFFLGLAAGSFCFGRIGLRLRHPLRVFALLEIFLGGFALLSPFFFGWADAFYGILYRAMPESTWALGVARTGLVGMVLLPATVIMGATIPLFCRQYAEAQERVGRRVGVLYGLNTLGAATGAAAAGFYLLPTWGLARTIHAGAALSLLFGSLVLLLPLAHRAMSPKSGFDHPRERFFEGVSGAALLLYFGVGFIGLGLQVVWYRFLSLVIRDTVYTYTLVLTVVLLGIVLGSWLAALLLSRNIRYAWFFGAFQMLAALTVAALMALPPTVWWSLGSNLQVCLLLLLIPSILGGASFPLAVRLVMKGAVSTTYGAGLAAAANTLGGVLGALVVGFFVIPLGGLQPAIWLMTFPGLVLGGTAWWLWRSGDSTVWKRDAALLAVALVCWAFFVGPGRGQIPSAFLTEPEGGELVDFREGYGANLAVVRYPGVLTLEINRWWQGEDQKNHQSVSAHIPALLHSGPRDVLLVGVGTGQTAARFLMHPIDRLDAIDIEPVIFDFIARHFESRWMNDPRARLIAEDGRLYLRHARDQYDIISLELGQIFRPGVAYFYTAEAYTQARRQLRPGGLLVQFLPLPFFTREQLQAAVGTFLDVFPQSVLWYNTSELLLIGANADVFPWSADFPSGPLQRRGISTDLAYAYWGGKDFFLNRPEVFAGGFLAGPAELARMAVGGERLRDDLPWLDYATAGRHRLEGREIELVPWLRGFLAPLPTGIFEGEDAEVRMEAGRVQQKNLGDIAARAWLQQAHAWQEQGNTRSFIAALEAAVNANSSNAEARLRLGDALLQQSQPDQAIPHFRVAAEALPEDLRAQRGLAFSLHRSRSLDEAIAVYRRALALAPEMAELHNNLGAALAEAGQFREAEVHFLEALRLRSDYVEARRNLERVAPFVDRG